MKRIFTLVASCCLLLAADAQNGITFYNMPNGYTINQLIHKTGIAAASGHVYVAFRDIGLGDFNSSSQTWTMYDNTNGLPSNLVTAVEAQGNTFWVGTGSVSIGAARLLSYNGSAWTDYTTNIDSNYFVRSIAASSSGTDFWAGTDSGAYHYNGSSFTFYCRANSALPGDTVYALMYDQYGRMVFGTSRGLAIFDGTNWTVYQGAGGGLPSDMVQDVYVDSRNGIWAATTMGAAVFTGSHFEGLGGIYSSPTHAFESGNIKSLTRGMHGGVIVPCAVNGGFGEMRHDTVDFYRYTNLSSSHFNCTDNSNVVWAVNLLGTSSNTNRLMAITGNNYYALSLVPNVNNAKYLDVNQVKAGILNRGDMHWDATSSASYEVPKGSGVHSVFASAIWLGGLDASNALHTSAMTYRQSGGDFFPGPLDSNLITTDSATSFRYDYIWKISRPEILAFQYHFANGDVQNGTYHPSHDFLSWPAHGPSGYATRLAPFVDVNGNGIYDPLTGGDYPDIKGDQMLYTIFNDKLAPHTETGGAAFGIEVHLSAYAFNCDSASAGDSVLNYTTYYHYDVINRSSFDYHDVYFTRFQDNDVGYYGDDFVGCYPAGNFGFAYNGDMNDGASASPAPGTYGAQPPFCSYVVLDGPWANAGDGLDNDNDGTIDEANEKNLMTNFHYYSNDFSAMGNPSSAQGFYNYMHSNWLDGTPVTYGGNGYGGVTPTRFMFDGDPTDTTWNETTAGDVPSDRRMLITAGPFRLEAGQTVSYTNAVVYSRSMSIPFGTPAYFNMVKNDVAQVQNWYASGTEPSCVSWSVGVQQQAAPSVEISVYPNPAHNSLTLQSVSSENDLRYEIFDMTGRVICSAPVQSWQTEIGLASFDPGIYFIRVSDGKNASTKKFVKQ